MTYFYIKDNHKIRLNQIMTTRLGSYVYKRFFGIAFGNISLILYEHKHTNISRK